MNSLSWFIYLTQVVPGLGQMFTGFAIVLGTALALSFMVRGMASDEDDYEEELKPKFIKFQKYSTICVVVFALLSTVIPNRQTLILIAASEVGEKVYQSDKVKSIIDPSVELLQEWIKKELTSLKGKDKIKDK